MTDQLHDVFTRMADQSEPPAFDPTLWSRARRSRRRTEVLAASAAGLAVLVLVTATGVVGMRIDRADRPSDEPHPAPGIPSQVRGVVRDGGLPSSATWPWARRPWRSPTPPVRSSVTAADGEYHRLDLPGFDASVYDDEQVRRTGMVGLSLSPDGLEARLRLACAAARGDRTGARIRAQRRADPRPADRPDRSRARGPAASWRVRRGHRQPGIPVGPGPVRTALVRQRPLPRVRPGVGGRARQGARWSSTGATGLDEAYDNANWAAGMSVYDTATGRRYDAEETRLNPTSRFWLSTFWRDGWPQMVADDGALARVDVNNALALAPLGGRISTVQDLPGGPADDAYTVGLFDGHRRAFVETRAPSQSLLAVDLRTGERQRSGWTSSRAGSTCWVGRRRSTCSPRFTAPRVVARGPRKGT